jgi:hypothetical protein
MTAAALPVRQTRTRKHLAASLGDKPAQVRQHVNQVPLSIE